MHRHRHIALVLGFVCFTVYLVNVRPMAGLDCVPARLLPFSILREGNLDLDEFRWLRSRGEPLFLQRGKNEHWFSTYPVATPLLVTPIYVPVVWWMNYRGVSYDDTRFRVLSLVMERISAALIAATSVALIFLALCTLTPTAMAAAIALVYGLGSSTWIISSQALWQHGPAELCLAGLSLCLLRPDTRRGALAAGGFAALGVMVRPTMLIFAVLATLFVWRERRSRLALFLLLPVIGAGLLLSYNYGVLAAASGGYGRFTKNFVTPNIACLGGLLISPSRGLLIYTPAVLLALAVVFLHSAHGRKWLLYLFAGIAAYVLTFGSWKWWWGANTYGPRYLVDMLPAVALCAAPAVERLWSRRWGRAAVLLLAAWGIAVQAVGVFGNHQSWNVTPKPVNRNAERLWDWQDSQIPRTLHTRWPGWDFAPLLWHTLVDSRPTLLRRLEGRQLAGRIVVEDTPPLRFRQGRKSTIGLRVSNDSDVAWPVFTDYGDLEVVLAYRWKNPDSIEESLGRFGRVQGEIRLPHNLAPGDSVAIHGTVRPPTQPGAHTLEITVAQMLSPEMASFGEEITRVTVELK